MLATTALQCMGIGSGQQQWRHFSAVRFKGSDHVVGVGKLGSHAELIKTDLFPSQTIGPAKVDDV